MNATIRTLTAAAMDLLEQTRDALLVWDMEGQVQYMNRGAEQLLGWSLAEAQGCSAKKLFFDSTSGFEAALEKLLRSGEWFGQATLLSRTAEQIIVESRWTLRRGDRDLPARVVAINTDITGRKRLEEAMLDVSQRIQRQMGEAMHDGLCQRLFAVALACATLRRKLEDQQLAEAADAARILAQINSSLKEAHSLALGLSYPNPAKRRPIRQPPAEPPGGPSARHGFDPGPRCRGAFRRRGPRRRLE
jgi:PAS domain S-box-containing protein